MVANFKFKYADHSLKENQRRLEIYGYLSEEIIFEIKKGDFYHLSIEMGDWDNLDFLLDLCPDLESLRCNFEPQSVTGIENLKKLKELFIQNSCVKGKLDFGNLVSLEVVALEWNTGFNKNIFDLSALKKLTLSKFKGSFSDVAKATSIEELEINQGTICNLQDIDKLHRLKKLDLYGLRKLTDITALSDNDSIEWMIIKSCNSILDIKPIGKMRSLKRLSYGNTCIKSISDFFPSPNLEYIHLSSTKIEDDDLGKCFQFPKLEKFLFRDRKSYSHKFDDVDIALEERLGMPSKYNT